MCGICGLVDNQVDEKEVQVMLDAIVHRGPDDFGMHLDDGVGIGNRRLSVIDLALGKQPISNEDESIWIVFNGEIYNYQLLKIDLEAKGHQFKTNSDTETIVHLYEEYGEDCVSYLRGMFALAIWDSNEQKLFLARDHAGQKPLFYTQVDGAFYFGSEIKTLLAQSNIPRNLNIEALHHYLSLRFIPPPFTMFKEIFKLPPASTLVWQDGETRINRYWQMSFGNKLQLSRDEDYLELLREKLLEVTKLHMISDVPVGAFLSGGMDSSIVVALMSELTGEKIKTFAVGVEEQDFDERPYANLVAEHCRTDHIETTVKANLIRNIPQMIHHLDEPSDPIAACQYHAAKLASKHVKVVLGGDGGDELFAGFDRYVGIGYVNYYAMIPYLLRKKVAAPILNSVGDSFRYKSVIAKARWAHQLAELPDAAARYAQATVFFRFSHSDKKDLFHPGPWGMLKNQYSADIIIDSFNQADSSNNIERMLFADYHTRLPEHSLMLTDRMTMAHSLELRSPLLDHELIELLSRFPVDQKIRRGELKYVLRKLGGDYLPASINRRPKQGFMFPIAYWFKETLHQFLKDFLLSGRLIEENIFRPEKIALLIDEHREGKTDHHVRLWMILNTEIWYRLMIDDVPVDELTALLDDALQGQMVLQ